MVSYLLLPPKPDKPLKKYLQDRDSAWSSGLAHNERWIIGMMDGLLDGCRGSNRDCGR